MNPVYFFTKAMGYVKNGVSSFLNCYEHLIGSGSWKVKPLQQALLDAFIPTLEDNIRVLVEQQVTLPFFMQFWNGGRISPFFFKNLEVPPELRIPDPEFVDRLYKVEMFVDGRKQHAHVTFYEGRIYSLEFKKPLKFYEGKQIRFGATTLGKSRHSYTGGLDRVEHGKDGHHATGEN